MFTFMRSHTFCKSVKQGQNGFFSVDFVTKAGYCATLGDVFEIFCLSRMSHISHVISD